MVSGGLVMIEHLHEREKALKSRFGLTGREAEWVALVCLHSGGVYESRNSAISSRKPEGTGPVRFVSASGGARRCRGVLIYQTNTAALRVAGFLINRSTGSLGIENIRHRREAE